MRDKSDTAIRVEGLSKSFRIPLDKKSGIKQAVTNIFSPKKGYREFEALKDVSFEIKKGEFFGIVGRNGSGKSTLLKILAGVYTPDSGGVAVNGSLTPFIELGVGFNPELSGRENVFLNGALLGFSRQEMGAMYEDIVDFAELHDFMEERLKNYSSGMQVRLAFSIAIRANSDILVLDEVLAVGDAAFQNKCFDYFRSIKNQGKTIVLVTHSMDSVMNFCTNALMLDSGEVHSVGDVSEVTDAYYEKNVRGVNEKNAATKTDKPVRIKSVEIIDKEDNSTHSVVSGESLRVRIVYKVEDPDFAFEDMSIGVGLHETKTNTHIFGYNTKLDNFKIGKHSSALDVVLENITLQKGIYYLSVRAFDSRTERTYDEKPGVVSLSFSTAGSKKSFGGLVNFDHYWEQGE